MDKRCEKKIKHNVKLFNLNFRLSMKGVGFSFLFCFVFVFLHQIYSVKGLPDLNIMPQQLITGLYFSTLEPDKNSDPDMHHSSPQ